MSYENLKSTKMLATHCAVCARPLRDAVSVELGIGPDCRAKYGYDESVNAENRERANQLIFQVADAQVGIPAVEACRALRDLGFTKLAAKIATRLFSIRVVRVADGVLAVFTPYTENGVQAMRTIPGRRWDKEQHASLVPESNKNHLWSALKRAFPGYEMLGPDGQFISIPG